MKKLSEMLLEGQQKIEEQQKDDRNYCPSPSNTDEGGTDR